ncbi:MAG: hypothetical protein KDA44_08240 [Planctomycetales bacterium]|nr:hypothetical protein [Planctomycetales bacterium]
MFTASRYLTMAAVLLVSASGRAHGVGVVLLDTSQAPLEFTSWNQGWWSTGTSNPSTRNSSPFLGTYFGQGTFSLNGTHRDFFTFRIPQLQGNRVIAASLLQHRGVVSDTIESEETIGLFDVTTDPAVLNHNEGSNPSVYADIGTGISYGEFLIETSGTTETLYEFALNAAAIADINAATGNYFSVGGNLLSDDGHDFIFGGAIHGPAELRLTIVPEPPAIVIAFVLIAIRFQSLKHCN